MFKCIVCGKEHNDCEWNKWGAMPEKFCSSACHVKYKEKGVLAFVR